MRNACRPDYFVGRQVYPPEPNTRITRITRITSTGNGAGSDPSGGQPYEELGDLLLTQVKSLRVSGQDTRCQAGRAVTALARDCPASRRVT